LIALALILACLLAAYLVVVQPVASERSFRKFLERIRVDKRARVRFYLRGIVMKWLLVVVVWLIVMLANLSLAAIGLQAPNAGASSFLWIAATLVGLVLSTLVFRRLASTPEGREQLESAMMAPLELIPVTSEEKSVWVVAAITAGVCEEILYRGFLIWYLMAVFPHMNMIAALIASSVFFGFAHYYQGLRGIIATGIIGGLLAWIYYSTGSLLAPIIIHALVDLRVMFLFPTEKASTRA